MISAFQNCSKFVNRTHFGKCFIVLGHPIRFVHLQIDGAIGNTGAAVIAATNAAARATLGNQKICGALFAASATIAADTTICTGTIPFKIR